MLAVRFIDTSSSDDFYIAYKKPHKMYNKQVPKNILNVILLSLIQLIHLKKNSFQNKILMRTSFFSVVFLLSASVLFGQSVNIPQLGWTLKSVTTFHSGNEGTLAFDGNPATYWHSAWTGAPGCVLPQDIQINLRAAYEVNGFSYLPRPDVGNGTIKTYDFFVSADGVNWGTAVSSGTFATTLVTNTVYFTAVTGIQYVKLVAKTAAGTTFASAAEINVFKKSFDKPLVEFSVPANVVKTGRSIVFTDKTTISPTSWAWIFAGGTPATSTSQNPKVTYNTAGVYDVTLKATNQNGSTTLTKTGYITVSDAVSNLALSMDGNDNNPRIGMNIINGSWTIEAWIKGNDSSWKASEVIIGGGEYSNVIGVDYLPLVLKSGKLYSTKANITGPTALDDKWHHVAATCNGTTTKLYVDGVEVASANVAFPILPGEIGGSNSNPLTFGGLMDEVRIWTKGLTVSELNDWKNKPIEPTHPSFANLVGYYNFEDLTDEVSVNLVGKGHQPYHIRNCRVAYAGTVPLAYTIGNDNTSFVVPTKNQELFNAVTIQSEWDADKGALDDQVLKLRVATNGNLNPLKLTELNLDLSQTTSLEDIAKVHVYYTGSSARSTTKIELFGNGTAPQRNLTFTATDANAQALSAGVNYFLVTFDVKPTATFGNVLQASVPSFKLNTASYTPEDATGNIRKTITQNSLNDVNTFKVLQWNIWHGGQHLGNEGRSRVKDLIAASNADIITMQEGYGAQNGIATGLSFKLLTASATDNLALFSRYPLTKIANKISIFNSNPAKITMPNGKVIVVGDWWLPYAYQPGYGNIINNPNLSPSNWIAEDLILATKTGQDIITSDITPNLPDANTPVIIGGDFNSGSHLDWTEAAKTLNYGYVADLPTSKMMYDNGYVDTYRTLYPNEVTHQGNTFAVIYGQRHFSRIDYIYFKGKAIKATASKIVRTTAEIDYVWAGDHAAVMTVFEFKKADFTSLTSSVKIGGLVDFQDKSTSTPVQWSWSFEGGTPASSTLQNPSVTYNTAGKYSVSLTVTGADGSYATTKTGYIEVLNDNTALSDKQSNSCKIHSRGKELTVNCNEKSMVEITDSASRRIIRKEICSGTTKISLKATGIYLVKVSNNSGSLSKKVVVE